MVKVKKISNRTYYYEGEYYSMKEAIEKAKLLKIYENGHGKGFKYFIEELEKSYLGFWSKVYDLWVTRPVTLWIYEKEDSMKVTNG